MPKRTDAAPRLPVQHVLRIAALCAVFAALSTLHACAPLALDSYRPDAAPSTDDGGDTGVSPADAPSTTDAPTVTPDAAPDAVTGDGSATDAATPTDTATSADVPLGDAGAVTDADGTTDTFAPTDAHEPADAELARDATAEATVTADSADAAIAADAPDPPPDMACASGMASCGGGCVDTLTNSANCGGCGVRCDGGHASMACVDGACAVTECVLGYADCDGRSYNGCETFISGVDHCGGCGAPACEIRPSTGAACVAGRCAYACNAGFADCDGNTSNGCETNAQTDRLNCGACGHSCAYTERCSAGACVPDPTFHPTGPCQHESDYTAASGATGATITYSGANFTPRCLRVAVGTTVTFTLDFAEHAIIRWEGGSSPNPIPYLGGAPRGGPWSQTVTFPSAGYFVFRCTLHASETGVVWVQ